MNKILIGIKPNIMERTGANENTHAVNLILKYALNMKEFCFYEIRQVPASLIKELYDGNFHQDSCVSHYKNRPFNFCVLTTDLGFDKINQIKKELRIDIKRLSGGCLTNENSHPADNSIHISDSAEAAAREIKVLYKHIT
jgi:hypothetical protein